MLNGICAGIGGILCAALFCATAAGDTYTVSQITGGPEASYAARGITGNGTILLTGDQATYLDQNGAFTTLPPNLPPTAISSNGTVFAGISNLVGQTGYVFLQTPSGTVNTGLSSLPGLPIVAGVNNSGQIVGSMDVYSPPCTACSPIVPAGEILEGFLISNGVTTIFPYPGMAGDFFYAINDSGAVTGARASDYTAFIFQNGAFTNLAPYAPGWVFLPTAINDNGVIAGSLRSDDDTPGVYQFESYVATYQSGVYSLIGDPLYGGPAYQVDGLNDSGSILYSIDSTGQIFLATPESASAPEPACAALFALGLVVVAKYRRVPSTSRRE